MKTIKFIQRHAIGPYGLALDDNTVVVDKYDVMIAETYGSDISSAEQNAFFLKSICEMADLLIKRATELYRTSDWISSTRTEEDEEFREIITTLTNAGIEVVYE